MLVSLELYSEFVAFARAADSNPEPLDSEISTKRRGAAKVRSVKYMCAAVLLATFARVPAGANENDKLKDNWQELASKVDTGYRKALRCEAGVHKSDRSQCGDFNSYMRLMYPRISYLSTTVGQVPLRQRQGVVPPREYDDYKFKMARIAEMSSGWGE